MWLESWAEPSSRKSLGGVLSELMLRAESGSRRSSGRVLLQLKLGAKSGSCRSPDGSYRQSRLATEPGSRRSPDGVPLEVGVVDGARLLWESGRSPLGVDSAENFGCGYFVPNTSPPTSEFEFQMREVQRERDTQPDPSLRILRTAASRYFGIK